MDLYGSTKPALGTNNSLSCSQAAQAGCAYEDDIFTNFTVAQIAANPPGKPLFLYFAPHNVHEPLEAPTAALENFKFVYNECAAAYGLPPLGKNNTCSNMLRDPSSALSDPDAPDAAGKGCCFRWYYSTMTNIADGHIGAVVAAVRAAGLWDNTLITLSSDNGARFARLWLNRRAHRPSRHMHTCTPSTHAPTGGPIYRNGAAGANNFPLRGGKKSNFEGGVRVNALVSGGLVPTAARGTTLGAWTAIEDLYRTYCGLAGADPEDAAAAAAGLPPVEGYDMWPLWSGANATGPRTEIWLGSGGAGDSDNSKSPIVQALIREDGFKVLYGNVIENAWTSAFYPNATTSWCDTCPLDCGTIDKPTCLFNVLADPTEHVNVAAKNPDIVAAMAARLKELTRGVFAPDRGDAATKEPCAAGAASGGFVVPFLP